MRRVDAHFGLHRSDGPRRVDRALLFEQIKGGLCRVDHQERIAEYVDINHVACIPKSIQCMLNSRIKCTDRIFAASPRTRATRTPGAS